MLVLAIGLQVPLLALFHKSADSERPYEVKAKTRPVSVSITPVPTHVRVDKEEEKVEPVPEEITGHVVTIRPPEKEIRPRRDVKYLANADSVVAKEVKAKPRPKRKRRARKGVSVANESRIQSARSRSVAPSASPKTAIEAPQLAAKVLEAPKSESGSAAQKTDLVRDQRTRALLPTLDQKSAIANVQALSGSGWSDDPLLEIEEEGQETMLNSRKFKHWDFFNTVKNRVRKHWHPAPIYRRRDPTGKVYGLKDRLTVVRVTLDSKGKLRRLQTVKDSGVEFLDVEARRALKKAAPFQNPPNSLVNKHDVIVFQFGFLFEISSRKFKFFRMPM